MRTFVLLLALFLHVTLLSQETYTVVFEGVPSEEVEKVLKRNSQLCLLETRMPSNFFSLRHRVEYDLSELTKVLHAFGYYDANITAEYIGDFPEVEIIIKVHPGEQYLFGAINIEGFPIEFLNCYEFEAQLCTAARSQCIVSTQEALIAQLDALGYPLVAVETIILVDKENKQVYLTYQIVSGPAVSFGPVTIHGLNAVDEEFVRKRILWEENAPYDPLIIKTSDGYLQESGLFSQVTIECSDQADEDGCLPIDIYFTELKHRHISAGITYSTDESFGGIFQWDHDNFWGCGEELGLTVESTAVIQKARVHYLVPDFYCPYQDLVHLGELKREDTRGYVEREGSLSILVERESGRRVFLSYGIRYERLLSTESDNNDNYNLISLPIHVHWDRSNDPFNPTFGTQINYKVVPHQNFFSPCVFFLKQECAFAWYFPVFEENFILASCFQLGSIAGQSRINIPAPKRFYIGSGNDLRGYAYKTVSPLKGDKPIGGRSFFILQVEPRILVMNNLYFIPFFDCGCVYTQSFPTFDERIRRAIGAGLRYLSKLGPLRLDVAFPLDRRPHIDSSFQIYASIGQTF